MINKIPFHHAYPVQIRFNDIDMFGHVNNAVQQAYFDLGRMYYMREIFGIDFAKQEFTLYIAAIKTDFHAPILLESNVEVRTRIESIGNKSLKMIQHLHNPGDEHPYSVSETIMVCIQPKTATTHIIPDEWKLKIEEFEKKSFVSI